MSGVADPLAEVFLNPGDFFFGGGHTRISTLLGSCVSITLWHPQRRIGGMCHYMLAERRVKVGHSPPAVLDGRYADDALALFWQSVAAAGTRPRDYQAKLFGGGCMFNNGLGGTMEIGARNIERGRELLAANKVALIAQHVGGNGRRKLFFDLRSGHVWLAFPEGSNAYIRNTYG
ncbi:MAG: putative chemotaxis protein [Proteobacteria bacterium]|nr:putative chemotaxis protein [Pseudomonadota bacterium]